MMHQLCPAPLQATDRYSLFSRQHLAVQPGFSGRRAARTVRVKAQAAAKKVPLNTYTDVQEAIRAASESLGNVPGAVEDVLVGPCFRAQGDRAAEQ
jgi:hypothetical protein